MILMLCNLDGTDIRESKKKWKHYIRTSHLDMLKTNWKDWWNAVRLAITFTSFFIWYSWNTWANVCARWTQNQTTTHCSRQAHVHTQPKCRSSVRFNHCACPILLFIRVSRRYSGFMHYLMISPLWESGLWAKSYEFTSWAWALFFSIGIGIPSSIFIRSISISHTISSCFNGFWLNQIPFNLFNVTCDRQWMEKRKWYQMRERKKPCKRNAFKR